MITTNSFQLEFIKILEEKDTKLDKIRQITKDSYYSQSSIFFVCKALVNELVPSEVIKQYSWSFTNKEMRWRHSSPDKNIDMLIGHIWDSWTENGELMLLCEVWGYDIRPELKDVQNAVLNGSLSISVGFKTTHNKNQEIIAIYGREVSLTPVPACTPDMGCGILEVSTSLENNSGEIMSESNKMYDLFQNLIKENKEIMSKLESGVIAHNELLKEQNIELEGNVEVLSNRIKELNQIVAEQNQTLEKNDEELKSVKSDLETSKTLKIREDIVSLERITEENAKKERIEFLKKFSIEDLEDRKQSLERAIKINKKVQKSKNNRPEISNELEGEGEIKPEEDPVSYALKMNPDLKKKYGDKYIK